MVPLLLVVMVGLTGGLGTPAEADPVSPASLYHVFTDAPTEASWVAVGPIRASAPKTELWFVHGGSLPDFSSFDLHLENPTDAQVVVTLSDGAVESVARKDGEVTRTTALPMPHAYFTGETLVTIREHGEGPIAVTLPPGKHQLSLTGPGFSVESGYHFALRRRVTVTAGDVSVVVSGSVTTIREEPMPDDGLFE